MDALFSRLPLTLPVSYCDHVCLTTSATRQQWTMKKNSPLCFICACWSHALDLGMIILQVSHRLFVSFCLRTCLNQQVVHNNRMQLSCTYKTQRLFFFIVHCCLVADVVRQIHDHTIAATGSVSGSLEIQLAIVTLTPIMGIGILQWMHDLKLPLTYRRSPCSLYELIYSLCISQSKSWPISGSRTPILHVTKLHLDWTRINAFTCVQLI